MSKIIFKKLTVKEKKDISGGKPIENETWPPTLTYEILTSSGYCMVRLPEQGIDCFTAGMDQMCMSEM